MTPAISRRRASGAMLSLAMMTAALTAAGCTSSGDPRSGGRRQCRQIYKTLAYACTTDRTNARLREDVSDRVARSLDPGTVGSLHQDDRRRLPDDSPSWLSHGT